MNTATARTPSLSGARTAALLLMAAALGGCAMAKEIVAPDYQQAAQQNFAAGMTEFVDEDFEDAKLYFDVVLRKYAVSKYATLAQLRMADIDFLQSSYPQASAAYARFVKSHPTHPCAPYAQYRNGLSLLYQVPEDWWFMPPAEERDTQISQQAYDTLRRFLVMAKGLETHTVSYDTEISEGEALDESNAGFCMGPDEKLDDAMIADAQKRLKWMGDRLLATEVYAARFYLKRHKPKGAVFRMEGVRADRRFVDLGLDNHPLVLYLLVKGYIESKQEELACPVLKLMQEMHPKDSHYLDLMDDYPSMAGICAEVPAADQEDTEDASDQEPDFMLGPEKLEPSGETPAPGQSETDEGPLKLNPFK